MIKLRSKKFSRSSSSKQGGGGSSGNAAANGGGGATNGEIKWELRPGGMLVQKRECQESNEGVITVRVSTFSQWHDISVQATSTFGELKMLLSLLTNLEQQEQRLLFKGKEREDHEYLHMVGVRDKDKVLMLEDPATRERKLRGLARTGVIGSPYLTISV